MGMISGNLMNLFSRMMRAQQIAQKTCKIFRNVELSWLKKNLKKNTETPPQTGENGGKQKENGKMAFFYFDGWCAG